MARSERLLLDTHVWLWLASGTPKRIRPAVLKIIEDTGRSLGVLVSIVSVWEIALLEAKRRIVLPLPLRDWIALSLSRPEIKCVGLTRPEVVIDSVALPGDLHEDPADRLLIATARAYRATLVTRDEKLIAYGKSGHVKVIET